MLLASVGSLCGFVNAWPIFSHRYVRACPPSAALRAAAPSIYTENDDDALADTLEGLTLDHGARRDRRPFPNSFITTQQSAKFIPRCHPPARRRRCGKSELRPSVKAPATTKLWFIAVANHDPKAAA